MGLHEMNCFWCKDTKIYNGRACCRCPEEPPLLALIEEIKTAARGAINEAKHVNVDLSKLTLEEIKVCSLIMRATMDQPIKITEIMLATEIEGERKVKQIIESLRRIHLLPIAASRQKPYGLYLAKSWAEWEPFVSHYKSQALSELQTIYRVTRHIWPEFAGQLKLNFEEEF